MSIVAPDPPLSDGVILLRPWVVEDVDQIFTACQDPLIQQYIPIPNPYARADAEGYVSRTIRQWAEGSKASFAIVAPDEPDVVLGAVTLALAGATGDAAYWIASGNRRTGLAGRALGLVTEWAFRVVGLGVVLLEIEPTNDASKRVASGAGYHEAGHLDVNDVTGERNHLLYSRLATDPGLRPES